MHIIERVLENKIKEKMWQGRVICLFGPRRSGKTTLSKKILAEYNEAGYYLNCENFQEREYLKIGQPDLLKSHLGNKKIIVVDEAQTIEHIGQILKIFVDTYPEIQVIATGSSSFELANRIGEPLVGRSYDFFLSPLSFAELLKDKDDIEIQKNLNQFLIYGTYPQIINSTNNEEKKINLAQIANNYLYKDIFTFENIQKPKLLEDLLKTLAFQIGQEVNLNELSKHLNTSRKTIERYLSLLEKTYVIKILYSLQRNRRDEVKSYMKIYFWDLGIRNHIINSFNLVSVRDDIAKLFENYFVIERLKYHYNAQLYLPLIYFWRTHSQLEIDYIEEANSRFQAFECKWSKNNFSFSKFLESYPESTGIIINKDNLKNYLL